MTRHYFLSGIGGSGMLPLALILKGLGHRVSGSDRGRDQGQALQKFEKLEQRGITLFPQDGSGLAGVDALVVSSAIEETVPDVVAARGANIGIIKRAALLASLFNEFPRRIAVGGTSGKTTVTGMIAYILREAGLDPVVMNGGIIKNYNETALVGAGDIFVTEADESDGSIALYNPDVCVVTNISIDHKSMEELRTLFGDFINKSRVNVLNADNAESIALQNNHTISYGLTGGNIHATDVFHLDEGSACVVNKRPLSLDLLGDHNISNALAAIAAVSAYGVSVTDACRILGKFQGIKRRLEWVGEAGGITVIDDFAHNPDKIAATLRALKQQPGRLLIMFQMHGYGPLKLMGPELAATFKKLTDENDRIFMPDPLYLGGTADKSVGTQSVVDAIGARATWLPTRDECGKAMLNQALAGDRLVVMGARDDTLSDFAAGLLSAIREVKSNS